VGINAATAFAYAYQLPLMGVNHLHGHIYAAGIENEIKLPALALLISGGHTELIYMKSHMSFELLGTTQDDAVGEAYDKVARTLGLSYPGGPLVDQLAQQGKDTYKLPRPYLDRKAYHFSFSGLKSAVINLVHNAQQRNEKIDVPDMCASFQASVLDVIIEKTKLAAENYDVKQIIVAGGVAANKGLRSRIFKEIPNKEIIIPSLSFCTDNAAMIGAAAYYQYQIKGALPNYLLGGESSLSVEDES
jgi:N6-L-threonylcarbamoyladenine synthase